MAIFYLRTLKGHWDFSMNCQLFTNRKNRESNIFKVNMLVEPDSYKMASNTKKTYPETEYAIQILPNLNLGKACISLSK